MDYKYMIDTEPTVRAIPAFQSIQFSDLPDPNQDKYNKERFKDLMLNMKGSRTAREFAFDTDLSVSFMNKAISGNVKKSPSKRTMLKLLCGNNSLVSNIDLFEAAGYPVDRIKWDSLRKADERQVVSLTSVINRYCGEDHFTVMCEFMRALSVHGLAGDVRCLLHRDEGYFEVTDVKTGQIYIGLNAYLRRPKDEYANKIHKEDDESIVFPIAFSVGLTYNNLLISEDTKSKIIYILTDDERVYEGCRRNLPRKESITTVIAMTVDHMNFTREEIISCSEHKPISLIG